MVCCAHWISNRVFAFRDIPDHGCFAWNALVEQPWTIMSIRLCSRAHRA